MENFCQKGKLEIKNGYDVCRGENWKASPAGELRYDLTKISPLTQTFGHYHTKGQVELFEVVSGQAMFFMQSFKERPDSIKEAYAAETAEKEKIIVPPNFSITTINPQKDKELIVSNWINDNVKNEYEYFEKLQGNCYRLTEKGFEKNENYKEVPELILLRPKKLPKELENLDFLNNPEKYKNILTIENLYEKI